MSTTYTEAEVFWGSESGQRAEVHSTGKDFKNVIVDYPSETAPYWTFVLTKPDDTIVVINSQNGTIIRPS